MESSAESALGGPEQSHSASLIPPAVHVTLTIYEEPLVVYVPANHPLATRHTVHIQDLIRAPWIAVAREPLPSAHEEIERCLHGYGVQLQVVAERHTAASWLVMEGVDLYAVGQILGHKTPRMTQRYAHLSPEYMAGAL